MIFIAPPPRGVEPRSAAARRGRTPAAARRRRAAPRPPRPVIGASRIPLRQWPVAHTSPPTAPSPDDRPVVGRAGPQARTRLDQLELGDPGQRLVGAPQELEHAAGGDRHVEALLLDGRADHQPAVRARHRVDLGRADHARGRQRRTGSRRAAAGSVPSPAAPGTRAASRHRRARPDSAPAASTTARAARRSPPSSSTASTPSGPVSNPSTRRPRRSSPPAAVNARRERARSGRAAPPGGRRERGCRRRRRGARPGSRRRHALPVQPLGVEPQLALEARASAAAARPRRGRPRRSACRSRDSRSRCRTRLELRARTTGQARAPARFSSTSSALAEVRFGDRRQHARRHAGRAGCRARTPPAPRRAGRAGPRSSAAASPIAPAPTTTASAVAAPLCPVSTVISPCAGITRIRFHGRRHTSRPLSPRRAPVAQS